ncbi:MAG TPA: peptidoglycan DD-metalloendopeptidase family protein [Candidatus Limnocylindria bacterium]|nr:peptidoglycan DD-metalloendopeptidase family protein [Candidatus Limnocylindria bacterium]
MRSRFAAAIVVASLLVIPNAVQTATAIYCYKGDPPAVYQACLAYNKGIGAQVANQKALQAIHTQIKNVQAQMDALFLLIKRLNDQIAAQQALMSRTQAGINELDRQVRLASADLTFLAAHLSERDQLLNQRLRYVDNHGAINYVQLVLTASSFNDLVNRMIGAQQVVDSDKRLLDQLSQERSTVTQAATALGVQRSQLSALLKQQKATVADMKKNQDTLKAAVAYQAELEAQLADQYAELQAQRNAIDRQVALLAKKYRAAAEKAGGGTGQFEWPEPTCGHGCISQGFGCNSYWFEQYEPSCPYPHRIHTGLDIAGPWGTPIIAADTGVIYFYPGYYGYGNYVIIIHGHGYSTLYGHLSSFARGLHSGQIVARGTLIALEGSTGNSTGPHLHFEIRVNNQWKNPCIWLGC